MNNNKTLSYIGIVLGVIAILITFLTFNTGSKGGAASNSVFDKVLSSGVLRAGYIIYPPYMSKDPKTGEFSGIFYDLTNAVGKRLGLKVDWVEEPGYGTIATSLNAGRYDVFTTGIWPNADRSKAITFSIPSYYDVVYAYARSGDHRFDNNLEAINSPQVRISTVDGELGDSIARESYPNAQRVGLPQTSPFDQLELEVVSKKADIVFLPPTSAILFLKANPGTLRQVSDTPVRVYGTTFGVKLGEVNLQNMISVVVQELQNTGALSKIVSKYDLTALKVALPYTK